jgi:hypothetical protein
MLGIDPEILARVLPSYVPLMFSGFYDFYVNILSYYDSVYKLVERHKLLE